MSPLWLFTFMQAVPLALVLPSGLVPVTGMRLSLSAQIAVETVAAGRGVHCRPRHSRSRPAISEYRSVLLVPSVIAVIGVVPFCRSAPLLPSPAHGTPAATTEFLKPISAPSESLLLFTWF